MPVVPPKPGGGTCVILLFAWLEAMPRSEVNEQPREQEDLLDARKDPSQNAAPPRRAVSRAFACLPSARQHLNPPVKVRQQLSLRVSTHIRALKAHPSHPKQLSLSKPEVIPSVLVLLRERNTAH